MNYFRRLLDLSDLDTDQSLEELERMYNEEELRAFLKDALSDKYQRDNLSEVIQDEIDTLARMPDDTGGIEPPGEDESEMIVRRYLDTAKLASFLTTGIWFGRLNILTDEYEGRGSEEVVRHRMDIKEHAIDKEPVAPYDLADLDKAREDVIRNQSFVSCWRYGGDE